MPLLHQTQWKLRTPPLHPIPPICHQTHTLHVPSPIIQTHTLAHHPSLPHPSPRHCPSLTHGASWRTSRRVDDRAWTSLLMASLHGQLQPSLGGHRCAIPGAGTKPASRAGCLWCSGGGRPPRIRWSIRLGALIALIIRVDFARRCSRTARTDFWHAVTHWHPKTE